MSSTTTEERPVGRALAEAGGRAVAQGLAIGVAMFAGMLEGLAVLDALPEQALSPANASTATTTLPPVIIDSGNLTK